MVSHPEVWFECSRCCHVVMLLDPEFHITRGKCWELDHGS